MASAFYLADASIVQTPGSTFAASALLLAWCAMPPACAADHTSLRAVTVTAERGIATPLVSPSTGGSRLGLTPLETPASVAVTSGDLIRALGTELLIDAKTMAPGVTSANSPGNGGNSLNARGFSGQNSVKQLYNGLEISNAGGVVSFPFDAWNVERIESLHGPASVLYGAGAIGGAINVMPKKPNTTKALHEVALGVGSDNSRHEALSSTGPLGKGFSYRFDLSHRRSENWVDRGESETLAVSAVLRFDATERLAFALRGDSGEQHPMQYLGTPVLNGAPVPGTLTKNYNIGDSDLYFKDQWLTLDTDWKVADSITLHNTVYRMKHKRRYRDVTIFSFQPTTSTVRRTSYRDISHSLQTQNGINAFAKFEGTFGGLQNGFLAGVQLERSFYDRYDNVRGGASFVDAFNPVPGFYRAAYAGESRPEYYLELKKAGVYMEDRLKVTERLSIVAGLRSDTYRTEREDRIRLSTSNGKLTGTSGSVGVVFNALPELAVYGQYATASDPVTSLASIGANQQGFNLSKGRQVEVGVKQSLWDGRLDWTLAAYRLTKRDLLTANLANPTIQEQVGQQSSRGIEASLSTQLGAWRFEANGTVLDAKFDNFVAQVGSTSRQLAGNVPMAVPKRSANLISFWNFAPGWTARSSLRYVGPRFVNNANTASMPGYTVLNAGLNWRATPQMALDLRIDNVTDKVYGAQGSETQWILGRPRAVWMSGILAF